MKHVGQHVSSKLPDLTVNFRTTKNDEKTLGILETLQLVSRKENGSKDTLKHEIFNENGAPYLNVSTNLNIRPLKFLVDTGASISLIANDVFHEDNRKIDYIVNLFGIMGKEASVKTEGIIHGIFAVGGHFLGTTLHVIDKKYAGPADGYLGYDFLHSYRVKIDLHEMTINISPKNIIKLELPPGKKSQERGEERLRNGEGPETRCLVIPRDNMREALGRRLNLITSCMPWLKIMNLTRGTRV